MRVLSRNQFASVGPAALLTQEWARALSGPGRKWVAFTYRAAINGADRSTPDSLVCDGWDGSFHDCHYYPIIACAGRTPARARRKLNALLASLSQGKDACVARFEARRWVREGD